MRSLRSNLDRKDHLLLEEVRKVVRGENFDAASFVDKVLGSIVPARRGEEHSWKMDFVSLLVSVRGDLCSAAGLRGAIQSYHRWGESPFIQGGGVAFDDAFFRHGQEDPSPENNCYTRVRMRLGDFKESGKLARLRRFLVTTFAGTEGLLLVLSALALAIRGAPQPDCFIVLIGPGSDGKSLVIIDLLKTAFQDAHAQAGPGVLQIPEEFRKNMRRHLAKLVIAFDEAMSKGGIQEAEVKAFLAGSGNDVRRLHETETATVSWPTAAKFWAMNFSDTPQLFTALDGDSWKRRFRVVKLSSTFVQHEADVNVEERRFISDDALKQLAKDQEFAKLFWVHFLLPFMRDNDDMTCYKRIKYPGE